MIPGGGHGHGKALKHGFIVVHDWARLAMHEVRGADDASAEGFADGLMSEADSEYGNFPGEMADQVDADARFMRSARAREKRRCVRGASLDFFHGDLIVAANFNLRAQFADVLDEVVGEGIVVVENENQGAVVLLYPACTECRTSLKGLSATQRWY